MKARYAFFARISVRWITVAVALGSFQVASASTMPVERQARIWESFQGVFDRPNSVVLDLKYPRAGTPLATSTPAGATPIGNMGATAAGNGVTIAGEVKAPLGNTGKTVAAVARAPVTRAAFLRGVAVAAGPALNLGITLASLPAFVGWLQSGGLSVDPQTGTISKPGESSLPVSDGYEYRSLTEKWFLSAAEACSQTYANMTAQIQGNEALCIYSDGRPLFRIDRRQSSCPAGHVISQNKCLTPELVPIAWSDIAQYMDRPESPALTPSVVAEAVTKMGVDPFGAEAPQISVTGPASVPGQKVQTSTQTRVIPGTTTEAGPGYSGETQPATRTSTQAATHNVTYNDNRVSYTTTNNTTTTITNNVTGGSSTTNETEQREDDGESECQKNPQSIACADLDTPDGEIPKATVNVTYQVEDSFGSGACPADRYATINGQSLKVYDYQQTCSYVSMYVRPILLVLCALGALFIVMPGKADA